MSTATASRTILRLCCWVALLITAAGCSSSVTTHRDPKADLARVHRFYVERRFGDDHHLDEYIVQELRREGHEATSGPLTMKPDGVDAIVTYADRWAWDFKNYLVELTLEVRNARTDQVLTTGRSYQPSITAKTPPQVIREILTPLFGPGAARSKS